MDKHIPALFTGLLAALLIDSFILYQAHHKPTVDCYFKTLNGHETHVVMGRGEALKNEKFSE